MREVTEIELTAAISFMRRAFLGFELGLVINNSYMDSKLGVSCKTLFVARHEQSRAFTICSTANSIKTRLPVHRPAVSQQPVER
jgi:hypothetical protein